MEPSPMPMFENERSGIGRDCLASYVIAGLQDEPAIFDLDPPEKFLPVEEEDD